MPVAWVVGGLWDAPSRTLTVSHHPVEKIGVATAGLQNMQMFAQGVGNKVALSVSRFCSLLFCSKLCRLSSGMPFQDCCVGSTFLSRCVDCNRVESKSNVDHVLESAEDHVFVCIYAHILLTTIACASYTLVSSPSGACISLQVESIGEQHGHASAGYTLVILLGVVGFINALLLPVVDAEGGNRRTSAER